MKETGTITIDGVVVGTMTIETGEAGTVNLFGDIAPDLDGYEPQGRAAERNLGARDADAPPSHGHGHGSHRHGVRHHRAEHRHGPRQQHHEHRAEPHDEKPRERFGGEGDTDPPVPRAPRAPETGGRPVRRGSAEVDAAIQDAAKRHGIDPNFLKGVASIESNMNPSSNARAANPHKGLFQLSGEEWRRFSKPDGNIYSARDNAEAAAAKFEADAADFKQRFGRDPTEAERYMIHQQGMGHFTRGALTNIAGNPYPGMHGAQTPESFREGWGREVARRKAQFENPAAPPSSPEATAPTSGRGSANLMHGQYGAPGQNLVTIHTPSGKPVVVHKDAAESFRGFLADLEASGYKIHSLGGYNHRNIAGSNRLSQHAYGNAIDINPGANPMRHGLLHTNLPDNVSDMAAKHGLSWGGDWRGRKDPMHFEWTGKRPARGEVAKSDVSFDPGTMAP
ncbi:M15 family metallopeptidase [Bradyrhizobium sp. 31Argb]|uniref:M15 family metallopeptidase n=1 Tax=Bradyrhizobium sp. 31Argb TaxID=3141247 RepID=UPI0037489217